MAGNLPLAPFKRVPFIYKATILGLDYSGATFTLEVRADKGSQGAALISISEAAAGAEGVSVEYDATFDVTIGGEELTVPASILTIQINETTLEGLDYPTPFDEPLVLHYDVHATGAGQGKHIPLYGTFTVNPGATL